MCYSFNILQVFLTFKKIFFVFSKRNYQYYKIKNYVNCDYLITNTLDLKNYVIGHGWDSDKVEFIPNFVDDNNKQKLEKDADKKIILCLGRFHKNKGIDILLKAMTYINEFELWIVGSGDGKKPV